MKDKEELLKKEKEEMSIEKEKFKQEMINAKNNEAKAIKQKQVIEKEKTEAIKLERRDSKSKILLFEGQDKIITDLLCEFLLKLNNTQYYISVFDLLNKSCKQYEEL